MMSFDFYTSIFRFCRLLVSFERYACLNVHIMIIFSRSFVSRMEEFSDYGSQVEVSGKVAKVVKVGNGFFPITHPLTPGKSGKKW